MLKTALISILLLAGTPAIADEPWGWELPHFGKPVRIIALYRAHTGSLVIYFSSLGKSDQIVSGLYDTNTGKQVATPAEMASIKDSKIAEEALSAKLGLTPIPFRFLEATVRGVHFALDDLSGPKCHFPYDMAFNQVLPNGDAKLFLIVLKRPRPITEAGYGCSYVDTPEKMSLRTRFQEQQWGFHWTTGETKYFVMREVPWVVRFDKQGVTHFFDRRKDAGLIRAEEMRPLVERMEGANARQAQALVSKVEAIIDAQLGAIW